MCEGEAADGNVSPKTGSRPPVGSHYLHPRSHNRRAASELRLPAPMRHVIGGICAWELVALYGPAVRGHRLPTGSHLAHRYKGYTATGIIGVALGMLGWHLLFEADRVSEAPTPRRR